MGKYLKAGIIFGLLLCCASVAAAGDLEGKIRAAGSDIRIFCPATAIENIQWTALLHLNRSYGAEIFIGLIHPSPEFGCEVMSTEDGQFHLARIGRAAGVEGTILADSIITCLFGGLYPDLAVFEAETSEDSLFLTSVLNRISEVSRTDTLAAAALERIFIRGANEGRAEVILNDRELFDKYSSAVENVSNRFDAGMIRYRPEQYRKYFRLNRPDEAVSGRGGFLAGLHTFRLGELISERLTEGPAKDNLLNRLDKYRNNLKAAERLPEGRSEQIALLAEAYRGIARLVQTLETGTSKLSGTSLPEWARRLRQKTYLAVSEALGIEWNSRLELRRTPFGQSARLTLDLNLTGPEKVELSYFRLYPEGGTSVIIDSISTTIMPHQRFYREYLVDLETIDLVNHDADSLRFSIEVIVRGLTLNLQVPYGEFSSANVALNFLPGYTFLSPFQEGHVTSLAQPFDWQLEITKPFGSELDGRLQIHTPDGVVVGSYDKNIFMPVGTTRKYMNVFLAAGRSIGYDQKQIRATLEVGGQPLASASADVRIVRCRVPETRDVGFVPDADGRLEDFLRMAKVSFQPFTANSLVRASLEAYDLIIIGAEAYENYDLLRTVRDRLDQFVRDGGEVLVMGQTFSLNDVFSFPIYASKSLSTTNAKVVAADHRLLTMPYGINFNTLHKSLKKNGFAYPAIINSGREIISAGEHGSLLRVTRVGDGHIIYCGLPLLEMAAELDVESIHLLANLLNFGHGE